MNYCAKCIRYDYCSARRTCINPPFGYCTRYQPKRGCIANMDNQPNSPSPNPNPNEKSGRDTEE